MNDTPLVYVYPGIFLCPSPGDHGSAGRSTVVGPPHKRRDSSFMTNTGDGGAADTLVKASTFGALYLQRLSLVCESAGHHPAC